MKFQTRPFRIITLHMRIKHDVNLMNCMSHYSLLQVGIHKRIFLIFTIHLSILWICIFCGCIILYIEGYRICALLVSNIWVVLFYKINKYKNIKQIAKNTKKVKKRNKNNNELLTTKITRTTRTARNEEQEQQ